ncbi:hypothetical protein JHN63_16490 [Streptomyces sp. MBT65]|uniref:hypothetical protein n=1 Tax=Streptomyces sp. MBT65 TaxID=1488395 RepID=UPI00190E31F8|nr:hypothetical protein [Streptomyces sp. MBT65]MBK3575385.1 hypothetical protein [Streptomyces sp. MBT65]
MAVTDMHEARPHHLTVSHLTVDGVRIVGVDALVPRHPTVRRRWRNGLGACAVGCAGQS